MIMEDLAPAKGHITIIGLIPVAARWPSVTINSNTATRSSARTDGRFENRRSATPRRWHATV
jgi:hypothetical protein